MFRIAKQSIHYVDVNQPDNWLEYKVINVVRCSTPCRFTDKLARSERQMQPLEHLYNSKSWTGWESTYIVPRTSIDN